MTSKPDKRENTADSDWRFHRHAMAWTHPDGLTVYVDPIETKSGAIRCLGPFSDNTFRISRERVMDLLASLTLKTESELLTPRQYVVWGTYRRCDPTSGQELPMLGPDYFFTPNIALRSALLGESILNQYPDVINREWSIRRDQGRADHRSGLSFIVDYTLLPFISSIQITRGSTPLDLSLYNEPTFRGMLASLRDYAARLLGLKTLIHLTQVDLKIQAAMRNREWLELARG